MTTTPVLPDWFAKALDAMIAGDVAGWMSIYAPDAVHEFPWVPEGRVQRLEGWHAINEYMGRLASGGRLRFGSFEVIGSHESEDALVVELIGHHFRGETPVELGYVSVMTLRNGKVTRFRDYMNPLQLSPNQPNQPNG